MRVPERLSIILFFACTVFGCSPPIGNITGSAGGTPGDGLKAIPKRTAYKIHQPFLRSEDLTVVSIKQGVYFNIPVSQVAIAVTEGTDSTLVNELYSFKYRGTKTITVQYLNMSDRYFVEVDDPAGLGGPGNDNDGGSNVELLWYCDTCGNFHKMGPCPEP